MRLFATKLTDKTSDPRNAKEQYKSFLRKKKHKVGETIKNNYSKTKINRKPKHY